MTQPIINIHSYGALKAYTNPYRFKKGKKNQEYLHPNVEKAIQNCINIIEDKNAPLQVRDDVKQQHNMLKIFFEAHGNGNKALFEDFEKSYYTKDETKSKHAGVEIDANKDNLREACRPRISKRYKIKHESVVLGNTLVDYSGNVKLSLSIRRKNDTISMKKSRFETEYNTNFLISKLKFNNSRTNDQELITAIGNNVHRIIKNSSFVSKMKQRQKQGRYYICPHPKCQHPNKEHIENLHACHVGIKLNDLVHKALNKYPNKRKNIDIAFFTNKVLKYHKKNIKILIGCQYCNKQVENLQIVS